MKIIILVLKPIMFHKMIEKKTKVNYWKKQNHKEVIQVNDIEGYRCGLFSGRLIFLYTSHVKKN